MPPKQDHRASKALISRGKRDVVQHESSRAKSLGQKPSTNKALILRSAKYGAVGSGEMQLYKKTVFGHEKLDLLAGTFSYLIKIFFSFFLEDLTKNAVRAPFDFEKLRRSIEAQYEGGYLDCFVSVHYIAISICEPDRKSQGSRFFI